MKRFNNILYVVESGTAPAPSLARAVALAESHQANLTVAGVSERISAGIDLPTGGPISEELQAALVGEHTRLLEALVAPHRERIEIATRVLVGVPFLEITRAVLRNDYDLVIKPPDEREWLDRLFSSDDMHLLRKCPCPVWLIKPQGTKAYRRVLAAVDVGDTDPPADAESHTALNRQILEMAGAQALADFAELHVVHVWHAIGETAMRSAMMSTPDEEIQRYVEQVRQQHAARLDLLLGEVGRSAGWDTLDYLEPRTHLVKGWARKEIPALAREIQADLVVMGTVGRTGIPGLFMGNTAETILNQIDCSVLAIKPPGFVTPVTLEE